MTIVTDKYKEICSEHSVASELKTTNEVMERLRKKKKPSYQRRRERGNK